MVVRGRNQPQFEDDTSYINHYPDRGCGGEADRAVAASHGFSL